MQDRPQIRTAIPRHRWQLGDYAATLLGDVESGDGRDYRWILAFVRLGRPEPELYVSAEAVPPAERTDGAYRLRVTGEALCEVVDTADTWGDREIFAEQALKLGEQALGLGRERRVQLM